MEQLQVNKWIRLVLAAAQALLGFLATQHWASYVDAKTAGTIIIIIGAIQTVIAAIAPGPGVPVTSLRGTGLKGLVFTHKADTRSST
jgi:hypothetical protein